jgi:hypothetical protein
MIHPNSMPGQQGSWPHLDNAENVHIMCASEGKLMATVLHAPTGSDGRLLSEVMASLQEARTPYISPAKVADMLGVPLSRLADDAGVHRNTLRTHPGAAKLQDHLRDVVKVITAASELSGDTGKAVYWFNNEPIADYRHKTPAELVAQGRVAAVLTFIDDLTNGAAG